MNPHAKWLAVLLLTFVASIGIAAEKASLARDTDLRSKALSDAPVLTTLKANTTVTIASRSGAWAKITLADGKTGYVRLLNLRSISTQKGDAGLNSLVNTFRTGASGRSVATGVKGMSEEQLASAAPAPEELAKLSALRASSESARSSAATSGLKAKTVNYLPIPDSAQKD